MKKLTLVLVVLLALGGFAFADSHGDLSVSVTGDAALTWGFDLDDSNHGFLNETSASATIEIAGTTKTADGDGWWGELVVELAAIGIGSTTTGFTDADGDEVFFLTGEVDVSVTTAKITDGVMYINILKPSPNVNFAEGFDDDDAASDGMDVAAANTFAETYGFTFGMDGDDLLANVEVLVFSNDDWESGNNEYGFGAKATLALVPDMVDLKLGAFYELGAGEKLGFGLQPVVDFGLGTLTVGFDAQYQDDLDFEVLAELAMDLTEDVSAYADAYYTEDVLDTKFGVAAAFAPVSVGVDVRLFDLINDATDMFWGVAGNLGYADGGLTLALEGGYDSNEKMTMEASVAADSVFHGIDNTVFTLAWSDFEKIGDADPTLGAVTFATKISF